MGIEPNDPDRRLRKPKKKHGCRWWLWGTMTIVFLCVLRVVMPTDTPSNTFQIGSVFEITNPKGAWFAKDEASYRDMLEGQQSGRLDTFIRMRNRTAFHVPARQLVEIKKLTDDAAFVSMLGGDYAGESGWIQRSRMSKEP